jgi:hypothetical protein
MCAPERLDGFRRHAFAARNFSFGFSDGSCFIVRQRHWRVFGEGEHQSREVVLSLRRQLAYDSNSLFKELRHDLSHSFGQFYTLFPSFATQRYLGSGRPCTLLWRHEWPQSVYNCKDVLA